MYVLAILLGVTAGITMWFFASHWVASSITWVEDRRPELVGSMRLRIGEAVVCGALVLAAFALAFWIARLLWIQIK